MKANYNIRKPEPSDVQAVANFRTVLEHGDYYRRYLTPDFYQWKYFQNPIHPSCVRVAEDRGRLIALAAATFKKLKIGETTFLCGELGDFLVHPEYRHQGIFTALAEEICAKSLADGARVIYVRPNDSSFPGLLRLGFKEVFRPKPMMKILNAQNVLRRRVANRVLFHLTRPIAAGLVRLAYRRSAGRIPPDLEISRVSCFDDSIDELWERAAKQYRTIVVRDKVYLNWRYAKNPRNYVIYVARSDRLPVGYVVINQEQSHTGLLHGYLVDILTRPDRPELMRVMISKALEHFQKHQADSVSTWVLRASDLYQSSRACGFRSFGKDLHFVVRTHDLPPSCQDQLKETGNWFFTMGETDGA